MKELAEILFSKNVNNLDNSRVLLEYGSDVADIFCMIIDLILNGIQILSGNKYTLFDLDDLNDEIVIVMKKYIQSIGFILDLHQDIQCQDFYIELFPKQCPDVINSWHDIYGVMFNKNFQHHNKLENYKLMFVSKSCKIYYISFRSTNIVKN
jgi:hypothetical protein